MTPPPSLQDLIDTVRQDSPSDEPLDLLVTASSTVGQLEETSDALFEHFVDRSRRAGHSWSEISAALGVSKQAVHKRFSGSIADRIIATSAVPPTFDRFTARARRAVLAGATAARYLGLDSVGTEHLLLGLYEEPEGIAGKTLLSMNISREAVAAAVSTLPLAPESGASPPRTSAAAETGHIAETGHTAETGSTGDGGPARDGGGVSAGGTGGDAAVTRLPFSQAAKSALRDALAVALEFGHNYIGTEHILLGFYRDADSAAARILEQLGAGQAEVKTRITELLAEYTKRRSGPPEAPAAGIARTLVSG
jgi:ATP-dependent Clp protease ATP-binding subunit ClpA